MTIEQAKKIELVDYLATIGHRPVRVKGNNWWFLSPIRNEKHASFKVNTERNEWYDFGVGCGGDIIELAKRLYHSPYIPSILQRLEEDVTGSSAQAVMRTTTISMKTTANNTKRNIQIIPLYHYALKNYFKKRHISIDVAKVYCREIHYEINGRSYFGIAFLNQSGGMEIRNPFFKGCEGHKDISVIRWKPGVIQASCCVFEGFFDFLPYMTMKGMGNNVVCIMEETDYIVLNSVNNIGKAFPIVEQYEHIHCYLDNDNAGHTATETLAGLYPEKVIDESCRYIPYNDLNDLLKV